MATNKRKTTTAIVAGVTALALALGGTFAWTSIQQEALNESAGIVNVGGRLHDDFNGENKDVYVENFTDPLNGGQPIYARVKLTEYMEVGQDAGGYGQDVNNDGRVVATPVIDGTDINDEDTWKTFIPDTITETTITCADCAEEGNTNCTIHNHWEWKVGGETVYMPTFNKDKDSLAADINGTYHGTDDTDKVYYDDYVVYTTDADAGEVVDEAYKETHDGEIYSVNGTAYYDDDTDTDDNKFGTNGAVREVLETHIAKETATATVMTMAEWIEKGSQPGNYWVYDTDGWAYWANPIMPGEATGLLLDGINMYKNPGEKCYYGLNVVAEFATVGDWEYFTGFNETDNADALELLKAASGNVTTVTVTNNGETTLNPGETTTFSATATTAANSGIATAAEGEFEWAVYNEDLTLSATSFITVDENGVATLTVGADEKQTSLIVAAKHTASGAVGVSAVAIKIPQLTLELVNADIAVSGDTSYLRFITEEDELVENVDKYKISVAPSDAGSVEFVSGVNGANVKYVADDNFIGQATVTVTDDGTKNYVVTFPVASEKDTIVMYNEAFGWDVGGMALYRDVEYTYTLVQDKKFVTSVPSANGDNYADDNGFAYTESNGWKLTDTIGEVTDPNDNGHGWYPYISRFVNDSYKIKTDCDTCCDELTISYSNGTDISISATYSLKNYELSVSPTQLSIGSEDSLEFTVSGLDYRMTVLDYVALEYNGYEDWIYATASEIIVNNDCTATIRFEKEDLQQFVGKEANLIVYVPNNDLSFTITITE